MRNIRFTFKREAQWLVAICVILPLIAILLGNCAPWVVAALVSVRSIGRWALIQTAEDLDTTLSAIP